MVQQHSSNGVAKICIANVVSNVATCPVNKGADFPLLKQVWPRACR